MKNLEELEKKYEELGKEIEKLKKEKSCKRWRAEKKIEQYFYIDNSGIIGLVYEDSDDVDDYNYKTRNYFKTEKEAQRYLNNINTYYELMDLAEELNNGKKIDWNDYFQMKYSITYDSDDKEIFSTSNNIIKNLGQIYCLDKNFAAIALERIGKERLEKLFKGE